MPWTQRAQEPPTANESHEAGRPRLNPTQIRHKLRLARKELGEDATNADVAELLGISERQLGRWMRAAG